MRHESPAYIEPSTAFRPSFAAVSRTMFGALRMGANIRSRVAIEAAYEAFPFGEPRTQFVAPRPQQTKRFFGRQEVAGTFVPASLCQSSVT
jgi:hypothetical protein